MKKQGKNIILCIVLSLALLFEVPMTTLHADTTVYTTATGKKYHFSQSCRGLNNARNIYTSTLSAAQAKGLTACSICASGSAENSNSSSNENAANNNSANNKNESNKDNSSDNNSTVNSDTVTLNLQKKRASLHVGDTVILKITNNKKKVTWSASNKNVKFLKKAKKQAKLKMKKNKKTKVKAKVNGKTYTWTLTIKK